MADRPIHYSDWSQQPDIHYACGRWTTPSWERASERPAPGVYVGDDGDYYTFDRGKADCRDCLEHPQPVGGAHA